MRRTIARFALLILASTSAWAQDEPVLRLINLQGVGGAANVQHRAAGDKTWYQAFLGTEGRISDHFKTDANTVAALEFAIGGRVAISKDTEIEVVSERNVNALSPPQRIVMRKGHIWMRSLRPLARPLEIQTNGGTLGIKGTEFTVEALTDETQVAVMDGAVEVKDLQAKYLGTAQPGDVYHLKTNRQPEEKPPVVEHLDHNQIEAFKETFLLRADMVPIRKSLEALFTKIGELRAYDENANTHMIEPFGAAIGKSPSGGFGLSAQNTSPSGTVFSWDAVDGADGYVIFVSDSDKFSNLLYSDRLRGTRAAFPETARPLKPGRYFWRVVPVGDKDQVIEGVGAAQSTFEISAAH